jgi:dUTP pyrophosphatase
MIAVAHKMHPDAILPQKATKGSAGYDLFACEDVMLTPGTVTMVSTGIRLFCNDGYVLVLSRSGLATKGVFVVNAPGLIDEDYTGEIKGIMTSLCGPFQISTGDRIAQLVPMSGSSTGYLIGPDGGWLESNATREGGFGSTGV